MINGRWRTQVLRLLTVPLAVRSLVTHGVSARRATTVFEHSSTQVLKSQCTQTDRRSIRVPIIAQPTFVVGCCYCHSISSSDTVFPKFRVLGGDAHLPVRDDRVRIKITFSFFDFAFSSSPPMLPSPPLSATSGFAVPYSSVARKSRTGVPVVSSRAHTRTIPVMLSRTHTSSTPAKRDVRYGVKKTVPCSPWK